MNTKQNIGFLIKKIRERKGLTQSEFAKILNKPQSVITRIESGGQNLTTSEIEKIGNALGTNLISLKDDSEDIEIIGRKKLSGEIETNTSKNGALALLCASLLNFGTTTLHGIPKNEEVFRLLEVFNSLDIKTTWIADQSIKIKRPEKLNLKKLNIEVFNKIRVGLYLLPILALENKSFSLPNPGGCKMGERTISAHKYSFENFGMKIISKEKTYLIEWSKKISPKEIVMYESSDTGTINTLLLASKNKENLKISFAPPNYQVQDVCFFLEKLGVKIEGVGNTNLEIEGIPEKINLDIEHYNSEDPIESMLFIAIAIVTKSNLKIKNCPIDFLKLEMLKLSKMGLKYKFSKEYLSKNNKTKLVDIEILGRSSKLIALSDKIHCQPYPGINVDNLPFFVPIACLSKGNTLIHDWMWENRAIYFTELNRLGAKVKLADPHRVFIEGVEKLKGSQVVCPPALRPATIILVAMLGSEGKSILRNIYSIKRGYENLIERLNKVGAEINILR